MHATGRRDAGVVRAGVRIVTIGRRARLADPDGTPLVAVAEVAVAAGRAFRGGGTRLREDPEAAADQALGVGDVVDAHRHVDDPRRGVGKNESRRPSAVEVDRVRDAVVRQE
jgi:hypothetical protein